MYQSFVILYFLWFWAFLKYTEIDNTIILFLDHPSLNEVWKKKLLLELKNSNKREKQTYKFRQFVPNDCSVICYSPFEYGHGPVIHPGGPIRPVGPEPVSILGVLSTQPSTNESVTEKPGNGKPGKPGKGKSTVPPKITTTGNCCFITLSFQIRYLLENYTLSVTS